MQFCLILLLLALCVGLSKWVLLHVLLKFSNHLADDCSLFIRHVWLFLDFFGVLLHVLLKFSNHLADEVALQLLCFGCLCSLSLLRGAMDWSEVGDCCHVSWSYSHYSIK